MTKAMQPSGISVSLRQDLTAGTRTGTTLVVDVLKTSDGHTLVMTDFGDIAYGRINGSTSPEIISWTGMSSTSTLTTLTGVTWGISLYDRDTRSDDNNKRAVSGNPFTIATDFHFIAEQYVDKDSDETITGLKTFSTSKFPAMSESTTAPVNDEDLATKKYVDDTAGGTPISIERIVVDATAGATVAIGDCVYLDQTANEWLLADASASASSENVQLAIAQGSGTNGAPITGGVLLLGRDENQSGFAQGDPVFLTNTPGTLANSTGTKNVQVGTAVSATEIDFTPSYYKTVAIYNEKRAMEGTSGTPSSENKFVTDEDTAVVATANKVIRADANGHINSSFVTNFGGTGSDGALTVSSGTTTLDADGADVLVKNYTTVDIQAGTNLTIENPGTNGTILILRVQGDTTIAGNILMNGMGAEAGTLGFAIQDDNNHFGGDGGDGGSSPGTAGSAGVVFTEFWPYTTRLGSIFQKQIIVATGSGGGDGGNSDEVNTDKGLGGRGGGCLIVECGGALDFSGGINVSGADGTNGTSDTDRGGGGGGGGACGMNLVIYNSLTANTGTVTQKGGDGGNGGNGTGNGSNEGGGSGGGAGLFIAGAIGKAGATSDGTNGDNSTLGAGASGGSGAGDGAVGTTGGTGGTASTTTLCSLIAENIAF